MRSAEEWRHVFQFTGTPVMHEERFSRFERLPPVSRSAFVLQTSLAAAAAQQNAVRAATS